jgi:cell division septum initiation protein DivIVA
MHGRSTVGHDADERQRGGTVTEVVYRLYETVDELTTVIENARSVPMSSSCMVPRDHLLDLLDDLRESLPEEVQQAGAIVEQRTEILQQAQAEAERLTGRTRSESEQVVATARRQREELLGTARRQRDEILTQAQAEADELLAEAEAEAERLVTEARRLREQLVADGQQQQAELIAAGEAEHERLLTETEVYRSAVDRADELGAQTATEVARMRAEVDDYVDTRLADFGNTLSHMVRSVEKARTNLRTP